ncbi:MAG TPA: trehalose utilization protein ThuA, partial [Cyanobacteria bacterium UBA11049]|nr:trehalose utilization protein ThuA [Cyanobacteria bacterium UBA11049]
NFATVEKNDLDVARIYPQGIHNAIAQHLRAAGITVQTATLEEPEHGLTEAVLENTEVLIWWGHIAHDQVEDEIVGRVQQRVLSGMGLIALHSGHFSKIFKRLIWSLD